MTRLEERLIALIKATGPMPINVFMEACLHDTKDGYYAAQPGLGRDFITAPETSQVFGELLGLWAAHEWQAMGAPAPFCLAELGPGRATLMSDALRASGSVAGFIDAMQLHLIEASPALQAQQAKRLANANPSFHSDLSALPDGPKLIFANEYLDCLPARAFQRSDGHWSELFVSVSENEKLCFVQTPTLVPTSGLSLSEDASHITFQPGLDVLVDQLKALWEAGAPFRALFIDYGPADKTPGDTLRGYREGKQVSLLDRPGQSDLTVDVDFSRLKTLAGTAGLSVYGPIPQGGFLMSLGAQERLNSLIKLHPESAQSLYDGVAKLVSPEEMGQRFNVLCISSPDLPVPAGF